MAKWRAYEMDVERKLLIARKKGYAIGFAQVNGEGRSIITDLCSGKSPEYIVKEGFNSEKVKYYQKMLSGMNSDDMAEVLEEITMPTSCRLERAKDEERKKLIEIAIFLYDGFPIEELTKIGYTTESIDCYKELMKYARKTENVQSPALPSDDIS